MLIRILIFAAISFVVINGNAQRLFTKSGKIEFFSNAPLEDIEAKNKSVSAALDTKTGALQFLVLMKGFEFKKALMQEHFNEDYVESDKYPKAEFKGSITNNSEIDYAKPGTYTAKVSGKLTIHGVTKDVATTATLSVGSNQVEAKSVFNVLLSDYNIKIPAVVKDNISKTIRITVNTTLQPLK